MIARLEAAGVHQGGDIHRAAAEAATEPGAEGERRSKYGNIRCEVDGIRFDSQAEARRYGELVLLERAGAISELCPSPEQPKKQRFQLTAGITYTPDFTYTEGDRRVAEDVKGVATEAFRLRAKLFGECHPDIELRIVAR